MYVNEIAAYTRQILDDPNRVFLSDSTLALFLQIAYNSFRAMAPEEMFEVYYQTPVALSAVNGLDLNGIMFGSAPTQARCQRITRVVEVTASGEFITDYAAMPSFRALSRRRGESTSYWLDNRNLSFSTPVSGLIQVWYMPEPSINWTAGIAASNTFVDDLTQWHDIIALLAAQQYAMKDASGNPKIDQRLALRTAEMTAFFAESRSGDGSRYVRDLGWS